MKHILPGTFLVVILAALLFAVPVQAKSLAEDKVVAGGSFTLGSGETLTGNLFILGGSVTTEATSRITGNVAILGGSTSINGEVDGSVTSLGGSLSLGPQALIRGNLTTAASGFSRADGAQVLGDVVTGWPSTVRIPFVGITPPISPFNIHTSTLGSALWFFFRTFLWAFLAALVVMFLPIPTNRVRDTIVSQPVLSGGVGLITAIVLPLLLVGIAITIILIPISLIGFLALAIAWLFGRIALGLEVGRRIEKSFNQTWPLPVSAGVGTFVLALVADGASELIACVGWIVPVVVGLIGLGGIVLSRFGTQLYPPSSTVLPPTVPASPVPPAPPTTPEPMDMIPPATIQEPPYTPTSDPEAPSGDQGNVLPEEPAGEQPSS